ncbi:MAG: methyltransferase domain-containing protein [Bacteriovorax sp.]|nr:methyltransferase domain-containing protein [Bacteriovorax sp.]
MNSKDYFNQFYLKNPESSYSKSLYHFFENDVRPRLSKKELNILDLGAGNYSLFENIKNLSANISAIDFSTVANSSTPVSKIKYLEIDLLDPTFFNQKKFDLIFDSHCLNCLTEESQRTLAFKNIYEALSAEGLFASEQMIQPENSQVSMPFKMIKSARELEEEILSYGLKIIYFTISQSSKFVNEVDGIEVQCDLVKIIAKKEL